MANQPINSVKAPAMIVDNVTDLHNLNLDGTPITTGYLVYPTSPAYRTLASCEIIGVDTTATTCTHSCEADPLPGYDGTLKSKQITWTAPFKVNSLRQLFLIEPERAFASQRSDCN